MEFRHLIGRDTEARLWLTRTNALLTRTLEKTLVPSLSVSETGRLRRISSTRRRTEYLAGRALMRHALAAESGLPWQALTFTETGALPCITPASAANHFSLSHSRKLVGLTSAPYPVGIDLEWTGKTVSPELSNHLNTAEDNAILALNHHLTPKERFLLSWCLREAWYKACSTHQATPVSSIPLAKILDSGWYYRIIKLRGYFGVITAPTAFKISTTYCTPFRSSYRLNSSITPAW